MPETNAVVLYDYTAFDDTELSLKEGETVHVLAQGDDGWWQGESTKNPGKIGKFPGSYVQIEAAKSKKEQFFDDLRDAKKQLEEENKTLKSLTDSKTALEKDIQELTAEKKAFEQDVLQLKQLLVKLFKDEKLDSCPIKLEKYATRMDSCLEKRKKLEECRAGLQTDLDDLAYFLKHPPASLEASKKKDAVKQKSQEKLESNMGILRIKLSAENKKRTHASEKFDELYMDLNASKQLMAGK